MSPSPVSSDYLHGVGLPPLCPISATDEAVCQVKLLGGTGGHNTPTGHVGGNWSATRSESVMFRIGWVDSHQASCQAYADNTTTTMTVDGHAVAFVVLPCRVAPAGEAGMAANTAGLWWTDTRYLSAPLSPGVHTASTTNTQNAPINYYTGCGNVSGCTSPAGTTTTFTVTVTMS